MSNPISEVVGPEVLTHAFTGVGDRDPTDALTTEGFEMLARHDEGPRAEFLVAAPAETPVEAIVAAFARASVECARSPPRRRLSAPHSTPRAECGNALRHALGDRSNPTVFPFRRDIP